MEIPVHLLAKAAEHRKACQECSKSHECDKAVDIGMEILKAIFQ